MVGSARSVAAGAAMTEQGVPGMTASYWWSGGVMPGAILRRVSAVIRGRGVAESTI